MQQDIQQLDKRVTSIETAVLNLTENLNNLGEALKDTTNDIKNFGSENHKFLDELKEEIMATKNELGRPNWHFWAIAAAIFCAAISGGYYIVQNDISHNKEITEIHISCQKQMMEKEISHLRELMEIKNGKN